MLHQEKENRLTETHPNHMCILVKHMCFVITLVEGQKHTHNLRYLLQVQQTDPRPIFRGLVPQSHVSPIPQDGIRPDQG